MGVDHRIAADAQHVGIAGRGEQVRHGHALRRILVGLDRAAGGDLADDRQHVGLWRGGLRHQLAREPEPQRRGGCQTDCAGLGRASFQIALALEHLEVMVYGRR